MEPATVVACVHLSLGPDDQTEQLEFLADHLNDARYGRARTVVCGDLNCAATSAPISHFKRMTGLRPLTNARHKTYPSWKPRQGLDHILTGEGPSDHGIEVEDVQFSDHLPVSAEFRVAAVQRHPKIKA
jgi:endonuclease/exonuclease/phosphatase family metal-dependent hydrolase